MVAMDRESIEARLKKMARLSSQASPPRGVPMDGDSVALRLREWAAVSVACLKLARVGQEAGLHTHLP